MTKDDGFLVLSELRNEDGNHLALRFVEVSEPEQIWIPLPGVPKPQKQKGFDFHSLVWDVSDSFGWTRKVTITKEELEADGMRRWVSDVHSFNPSGGTAIIRIAEENGWNISYSWREWDLCRNQQIRMVKLCDCPFEPFGESSDG